MSRKFSEELCEALYSLSLDGGADEEAGDANYGGWYGLMTDVKLRDLEVSAKVKHLFNIEKDQYHDVDGRIHAILYNDSQGFIDCTYYSSAEKAQAEFDRVAKEIAEDESGEGLDGVADDEGPYWSKSGQMLGLERGGVPGLSKWHMHAAGVSCPDTVHGYVWPTDLGTYKIHPICRNVSRRGVRGYSLTFENTRGALDGGLHQGILPTGEAGGDFEINRPRYRSPQEAVGAARRHYETRGKGDFARKHMAGRSSAGNRCRNSRGQFARCR